MLFFCNFSTFHLTITMIFFPCVSIISLFSVPEVFLCYFRIPSAVKITHIFSSRLSPVYHRKKAFRPRGERTDKA